MLSPNSVPGSSSGSRQYRSSADPDEAVRSTDDDAAASRLYVYARPLSTHIFHSRFTCIGLE